MMTFITQPTYLPWIGIFKAIELARTFVFYDDVQFERKSWQNRNRVLDPARREPALLTVPVAHHPRETAIRGIQIADRNFYQAHLRKLESCYRRAPCYAATTEVLREVYSARSELLSDLTCRMTMALASYIGLSTDFKFAHDFDIAGDRYTRPLAFARALGSTAYLTQGGTRGYTDVEAYRAHGIRVIFLEFRHPEYRQASEPFTPYLSIVDALMNIGPQETASLIRAIRLEEKASGRQEESLVPVQQG